MRGCRSNDRQLYYSDFAELTCVLAVPIVGTPASYRQTPIAAVSSAEILWRLQRFSFSMLDTKRRQFRDITMFSSVIEVQAIRASVTS